MPFPIRWNDWQRSLPELVTGVRDAMAFNPARWVPSIVGGPRTWLPPYGQFSEHRQVMPLYARTRNLVSFWPDVLTPSLPVTTPGWAPDTFSFGFWRPSTVELVPDNYGSTSSFPDESWFLINGIMTNGTLARVNARYIAHLFRRPVTLIQNATSGFVPDILECAVGKVDFTSTEAAKVALPPIYQALVDPNKKRVVILAHSQGTIIAANVLERLNELHRGETAPPGSSRYGLEPLSDEQIGKLEIYCFANAATRMDYAIPDTQVPWIESYANEWDLVARLGVLAPNKTGAAVRISGPTYRHNGMHGHLLNGHYLSRIEDHQVRGQRKGGDGTAAPFVLVDPPDPSAVHRTAGSGPRLFSYLNGGAPADDHGRRSPSRASDHLVSPLPADG